MDQITPKEMGWHEYVMSKFDESELDRGYPKVDGLRRVTELLLGDIIDNTVEVVQCPCPDNGERATAVYTITIRSRDIDEKDKYPIKNKIYSDAADSCPKNTKVFGMFPVAIAVTRAEARTLRKALRLKTIAAEELEEFDNVEKINDNQITAIDIICKRIDINVKTLLDSFSKKFKYENYKDLPKNKVLDILEFLNKMQSNPAEINEKLKPYSENWRQS